MKNHKKTTLVAANLRRAMDCKDGLGAEECAMFLDDGLIAENTKLRADLAAEVERLRSGIAQLRLDATGWEAASLKPAVYQWLIRRLDALAREDGGA